MKTSTLLRFAHVATRYHLTGQRAPLNTMIALTDQCNARCGYCDIPSRGRPGLESKALLLRSARLLGRRASVAPGPRRPA
jgi:2-iminoacetate synthase ThiH